MRRVIDKFDSLEMEGLIEVSEDGKMYYQKHSSQPVTKVDCFIRPGKTQFWQMLLYEMRPASINVMWRPVKGGPDARGRTRRWQLGGPIPV